MVKINKELVEPVINNLKARKLEKEKEHFLRIVLTNDKESIKDVKIEDYVNNMDEIYEVLDKEDVTPIFVFNELGYVVYPIDRIKKIRKPIFSRTTRKIHDNTSSDGKHYWGEF